MTTMKGLVVRHPVAAYVTLTFAISWGGVLLVIGGRPGMGGPKAQDNPLFPFAVLAMLAGPIQRLRVAAMRRAGFIVIGANGRSSSGCSSGRRGNTSCAGPSARY